MIDETVEEIEDMQTHSSSEVAVTAARALRAITEEEHATVEEYLRSLSRNARALRHANPSHATLFTTMHAIVDAVEAADPPDLSAAREATTAAIDAEIERVQAAKDGAAENAQALLEPGGTYMTLDFSTTLLTALERASDPDEEAITVYCLESRPRYLGRKMARSIAGVCGLEAHLVVDGASGSFVRACDRVLVGMTCIVDGTLYNRVGTYPLAAVADHAGTPMHAVGARTKVVDDAFVFEHEERSASEVSLEPLPDVAIDNPAYDATPVSLVTSVITDEGALFD
ncbi:MAG: translation initiation factor eIF-2B [Halobacteriales archaeon]